MYSMSPGRAFRLFIEEELGKFPHLVVYAFLEWTLIALLFLDGFLAFFSSEFAKFFDLRAPCVLCTRIDHIFTRNKTRYCYNESICEGHKKELSSLAYCHFHGKLSDIRRLCEGCLLSFATNYKSESEAYKSFNGVLNKDLGLFDDEMRAKLTLQPHDKVEAMSIGEKARNTILCSCCREPMKVNSSGYHKGSGNVSLPTFSSLPSRLNQLAPTPSPRGSFLSSNADEAQATLELSQIRCRDLRMSETNTPEEEDITDATIQATTLSLPTEQNDDFNNEDFVRTPPFSRGNRFFGISDSAASSPRWANRMPRKSLLDKVELVSDPVEAIAGNETNTEAILNRLKTQVRSDKKSLIALYMELDEERSASAVAANNAMAMITRLQADKAAVQMEALQYQRMMEEQAEYDQEAIQTMKEFIAKREDEIKDLEAELDLYRDRYGEPDMTHGDHLERSQSFSSITEHGSPLFSIIATDIELDVNEKGSRTSNEEGDKVGGHEDNHENISGSNIPPLCIGLTNTFLLFCALDVYTLRTKQTLMIQKGMPRNCGFCLFDIELLINKNPSQLIGSDEKQLHEVLI